MVEFAIRAPIQLRKIHQKFPDVGIEAASSFMLFSNRLSMPILSQTILS